MAKRGTTKSCPQEAAVYVGDCRKGWSGERIEAKSGFLGPLLTLDNPIAAFFSGQMRDTDHRILEPVSS